MPSIADLETRHSVIDDRPGHYLSFPDVTALPGGGLLCMYREADKHVPSRRKLLVRESADGGRSWSKARAVAEGRGHCPRLAWAEPGLLTASDDGGALYLSDDAGKTWSYRLGRGVRHGVTDRILPLDGGDWLTTAHRHLESEPDPATGQSPTEQVLFLSRDHGRSWDRQTLLAGPGRLVLCEASITRLPDGRLLALMRENSHVCEPMYRSESVDGGKTWTAPSPTQLIGHRPTVGVTRAGKLLVTYRNTGPSGGTAAWLGPEEELDGFAPQGSLVYAEAPDIMPSGLLLNRDKGIPPLFALRPLTDPDRQRAVLEAEVRCQGGTGCCVLRLGGWWLVERDRLALLPSPEDGHSPDVNASPLAQAGLAPDSFHRIRLEWEPGTVRAFVNGALQAEVELDAHSVRRRPVMFGAPPFGGGSGHSLWRMVRQRIERAGSTYEWTWGLKDGQPDAKARRETLLLAASHAAWCDYGYTGWTETEDGDFFCAYHHATGEEPGYKPGDVAHVRGTRFFDSDFCI